MLKIITIVKKRYVYIEEDSCYSKNIFEKKFLLQQCIPTVRAAPTFTWQVAGI